VRTIHLTNRLIFKCICSSAGADQEPSHGALWMKKEKKNADIFTQAEIDNVKIGDGLSLNHITIKMQ